MFILVLNGSYIRQINGRRYINLIKRIKKNKEYNTQRVTP